ncbi:MAG: hypothetical protein IKX96_02575 [Firmicutes bacterium]|nr:hypothetical protein [Bacillota bacterium]
MKDKLVPIAVGITGHRNLSFADEGALRAAVGKELNNLKKLYPASPLVLLTSLAEGGDLLCADCARELGIPLSVALPYEKEAYIKNYAEEDKARFNAHFAAAAEVFDVPEIEARRSGEDEYDYWFRQAGIYVAEHSQVQIALWDGCRPKTAHGCGTAEAVGFSLNGSFSPKGRLPICSSENNLVIHVMTPREAGKESGAVSYLGNKDKVFKILKDTDDFNKAAAEKAGSSPELIPGRQDEDAAIDRLETLYNAADSLSLDNAALYKKVLAYLALASTAIAAAFLLYDEANLTGMLLVCGIMLILAFIILRFAKKSDCHRKYIEYRVLAESLRVQIFLRYAGLAVNAAELFTWSEREESAWVMDALCALHIGSSPSKAHDIKDCWIEDQKLYHEKAQQKTGLELKKNNGILNAAFILSIVVYAAALIFEITCGGMLSAPAVQLSGIEGWRTAIKILLGLLSVATLFMANYYGKQSLTRKASDHGKMKDFYAAMAGMLERNGQTEEILLRLAKEELIENGNWCSYQRDNAPDFNL